MDKGNGRLGFDWSVVTNQCWHAMKGKNYEGRTEIESVEFGRNIAKFVLYYIERFKPEEIVFFMDSRVGYWRHDTTEAYYKEHCKVKWWRPKEGDPFYTLAYDKKIYRISWLDGADKYISKKLIIAEVKALDAVDCQDVDYDDIPEEVIAFFPKYKGNRATASWDYKTTRAEWYVLCANLVKNLAVTCKSKIIQIDKAEADDISKVYADMHSAKHMIFITTDSDWNQLLIDHLFLKIFNPRVNDWVRKTRKQNEYDLAFKLLTGDASDNIAGLMTPKPAEALIAKVGMDKIYESLTKDVVDQDALYRNYELILLENMPEDIEESIKDEINVGKIVTSKKEYKWAHFDMNAKDVLVIKGEALQARKIDIEDREVSYDA